LVSSVVKVLEETDEEGFRRIKILDRLREIGAIDIGTRTET